MKKMTQKIRVGIFTPNIVLAIAEAAGFLNQEHIRVEIESVTDSASLLRNLIGGKYEIILANADNVISWCEGQGADRSTNDLIIVLGGSRGVNQKLVVAPEIKTLDDLRGKILAVDAPTTGYAVVGVYILKTHGLELNVDYRLQSFGNTIARAHALRQGEAAAAMMGMSQEEISRWGFRIIARAEEYVADYARGLGTTRRSWADTHRRDLVGFCRAMIRAAHWIAKKATKEQVIGTLGASMNSVQAEKAYSEALSREFGLEPLCRIDTKRIYGAIELRNAVGFGELRRDAAEKYVDKSFYEEALATCDFESQQFGSGT